MAIRRPVRLWRAQPGAGDTLSLAISSGSQGWLQLIAGSGEVDRMALNQGDGLGYAAGPLEAFTAGDDGADLLLFELR
jgi:quercetin 2,3-dioxygenase